MSESRQQRLDDALPSSAGEIESEHAFRAAWKQPEDIDRILREATAERYTLNVCAGESPLGDVQVDAQPRQRGVIPADMNQLPFADNSFEAAIVDPPWNLNYFKRQHPLFEPIRVVEPNGVVFFNARWIGESTRTRIDPPILIRSDDPWGDISVIVAHRVDPDQQDLTHWGAGIDDVPTRPNPLQMATCGCCGNELPRVDAYHSDHLDPDTFCSLECMHRLESEFGEALTLIDDETGPYPAYEATQRAFGEGDGGNG